jgi:sporulation protein YlmC with PRC-barrel domain
LGGCNNGRNVPALNDVVFDSIPSNAYFVAENEDWKILLNDEAIGDSIEGMGAVKQMSLWAYNKSKKSVKKLMMSHPHANGSWFTMEHAVKIPLDSIPTITKVIILSWEGEPLKLFAEGTSDFRNILSFIIDTNSDKAICLPTNRGLIGVSEEDALLIMHSYAYYEDGGRFNVIEAFDAVYGNRISTMEARVRNN